MSRVLAGCKPEKVFYYFEEICKIPHGSGNTKQISDYLVAFAKERGLFVYQDESNNVIIRKKGSAGCESAPTVMIQGHMDMVCEKNADISFCFETDGLNLGVKDGYVHANGTTLGGDDGVAVAFGLALLDSDDLVLPPLEVVITVDEEIGLLGAATLDPSALTGHIMLNLDSEVEGQLLLGCAGGVRANCHFPIVRETASGFPVTITVRGLAGGHSGICAHEGRANANVLLGRILGRIKETFDFSILSLSGGAQDNAITRESVAELLFPEGLFAFDETLQNGSFSELSGLVRKLEQELRTEFAQTDPDLCIGIDCKDTKCVAESAVCGEQASGLIHSICALPHGVQQMNPYIPGMVQTSLNLGVMKTSDTEIECSFCVRSDLTEEKELLCEKLRSVTKAVGGSVTLVGDYPGWPVRNGSPLQTLAREVFVKQYGKEPVMESVHAGVECGLFAQNIENYDCVSLGPNILDIHSPEERLDIVSTERVWNYVVEILTRIADGTSGVI